MGEPGEIACIVLAAGRSTRMGAINKLTAEVGGKAMVRHVVEAALASRAHPVLVVTGHEAAEVQDALAGLNIVLVDNPDYARGMSTSLIAGLAHLRPCDGALILLSDMPKVTAAHIDQLIDAFFAADCSAIIVPAHAGKRGNPVLWPAGLFAEMLELEGDRGAKALLTAHAAKVREVELGTDAIFADVDTPDELARLCKR